MFALLAIFVALVAGPSVSMKVTLQPGVQNVHVHYTVVGPYEGRVCVDVDTPEDQHVAGLCAQDMVAVKAGETQEVDHQIHGPAGDWKLMAVLPDVPDGQPAVMSAPQRITVEQTRAAEANPPASR